MPSSQSSGDETRTQVIDGTQKAPLSLQHTNVIQYTRAVAQVAIHTIAEYDGPDALILCSSEQVGPPHKNPTPSPSNCRYYRKKPVSEGTKAENLLTLAFTAADNEGTADLSQTTAKQKLSKWPFSLFLAPTGAPEDACIGIFHDRDYEDVWSVDETPSFAAQLLATRFAEAADVALPDEDQRHLFTADEPLRPEAENEAKNGDAKEDDAKKDGESKEASEPKREEAKSHAFFVDPKGASTVPIKSRPADSSSQGSSEGTSQDRSGSKEMSQDRSNSNGTSQDAPNSGIGLSPGFGPKEESALDAGAESAPNAENEPPPDTSPSDESTNPKESTNTFPSSPSFERPPGDRWIHLFRQNETRPETRADVYGIYKVTDDGKYKYAQFENGSLSVMGDPQKQVLLPLNSRRLSDAPTYCIYARLSPFRVSETRIDKLREKLPLPDGRDRSMGTVVPLCFGASDGPNPGLFYDPLDAPNTDDGMGDLYRQVVTNLHVVFGNTETAGHVAEDADTMGAPDPVLDEEPFVLLYHPLAVLERRLGVLAEAHARYTDWADKMGEANVLAELVSATCHGGEHARSYLTRPLQNAPYARKATSDADETADASGGATDEKESTAESDADAIPEWEQYEKAKYDMEYAWRGAPLGENGHPESPEGHTVVQHFAYGAKCQRRYLRRRYRRKRLRLRRLVGSGHAFKPLVLDALTADLKKMPHRVVVDRLFAALYSCLGLGAGNALTKFFTQRPIVGTSIVGQMAEADNPLKPLEETKSFPMSEALTSPPAKSLFKLARGSAKWMHAAVDALNPVLVTAEMNVGQRIRVKDGKKGPLLPAALRAYASWTTGGGSGTPALQVEDAPNGATVTIGDSDYGASVVRAQDPNADAGSDGGDSGPSASARKLKWTLKATKQVKSDLDATRSMLEGTALTVMGVEVLINGYVLTEHVWKGQYKPTDAMNTVKGAVDTTDLIGRTIDLVVDPQEGSRARSFIRGAGKVAQLGPYLEMVGASVTFVQQATHHNQQGQATVSDPNLWGSLGAATTFLAAGAQVVGLLSGGSVLLIGAIGAAMIWKDELDDIDQNLAADPLHPWLKGTVWGRDTDLALEKLFQLVKPGKDRQAPSLTNSGGLSAPPNSAGRSSGLNYMNRPPGGNQGSGLLKALRQEAQTFADKGFHFPVDVSVWKEEQTGMVVGLKLEVALGYVPSVGSLMVDGSVDPMVAGVDPIPLEGIVHYVKMDDKMHYRAAAPGTRLSVPDGSKKDIQKWIEEEKWARSLTWPYRFVTSYVLFWLWSDGDRV